MKSWNKISVQVFCVVFIALIVISLTWILKFQHQIYNSNHSDVYIPVSFSTDFDMQASAGSDIELADCPTVRFEQFKSYISKGKAFFNRKQYRQAASIFHKAEAMNPVDPTPRYYLMLCYANLEDNPYMENSMTLRMALEVKALAPGTPMAAKADRVLEKYFKNVSNSGKQERSNEIKSGSVDKKFNNTLVPGYKEDGRFESQEKVTLKGIISRPDERGVTIYPGGVELILVSADGSKLYKTVSDSKGRYVLRGVEPKVNYSLVAFSRYTFSKYFKEIPPVKTAKKIARRQTIKTASTAIAKNEIKGQKQGSTQKKSGLYVPLMGISMEEDCACFSSPSYVGENSGLYTDSMKKTEENRHISWHLKLTLDTPGVYQIDLDKQNADRKFISSLFLGEKSKSLIHQQKSTETLPVAIR
jgi:tetratricopeptide (TPR) repeat protein